MVSFRLIIAGIDFAIEAVRIMVDTYVTVVDYLSELSMTLLLTKSAADTDEYEKCLDQYELLLRFLSYIAIPEMIIPAYYDEITSDRTLDWWFRKDPYLSRCMSSYEDLTKKYSFVNTIWDFLEKMLPEWAFPCVVKCLLPRMAQPMAHIFEMFLHVPLLSGYTAQQGTTAIREWLKNYDHLQPVILPITDATRVISEYYPTLPFHWACLKAHIHSYAWFRYRSTDPSITPSLRELSKSCKARLLLDGKEIQSYTYRPFRTAAFWVEKKTLYEKNIQEATIDICGLTATAYLGIGSVVRPIDPCQAEWGTMYAYIRPDSPLPDTIDCMPEKNVCHKGIWYPEWAAGFGLARCRFTVPGTFTHLHVWVGVYFSQSAEAAGMPPDSLMYRGGVRIYCNIDPIADFNKYAGFIYIPYIATIDDDELGEPGTPYCYEFDVPLAGGKPVKDPLICIARWKYSGSDKWFDIWVGPVVLYRQ